MIPTSIPFRAVLVLAAGCLGTPASGCVVHDDVGRDPHHADPHAGEHHEDRPPEQPQQPQHQEDHHP